MNVTGMLAFFGLPGGGELIIVAVHVPGTLWWFKVATVHAEPW
jgi:hypothetical protein